MEGQKIFGTMKNHNLLNLCLLIFISTVLTGCKTLLEREPCCEPVTPCAVIESRSLSGTDLDLDNMEKVIISPKIKAYPIGRYIDPNDPNLMHEGHIVYRQEAPSSWNRNPNAPTAVPLGPTIAVSHPERQQTQLSVEYETKIMQQNLLMKSLIEQNEVLLSLTQQLKEEIQQLKQSKNNK